jgi:osmoprotectant transport system permease protein
MRFKTPFITLFAIIFLGIILLYTAWPFQKKDETKLVIGSKRFTESYILGEIFKQIAERENEGHVEHRQGFGNTGIAFTALREGLIDAYPEYTGTIASEILKNPEISNQTETIKTHLNSLGLEISEPLGFYNNYALAMLDERAEKLGVQTISDLSVHSSIVFGFTPEFHERKDGWRGIEKSGYNFLNPIVKTIDHSLGYEALIHGQIDVTDIYTTDPKIEKYHLRVLEDDLHFFPIYDGVLLYRQDSAARFPKLWKAFQKLSYNISTDDMIRLNSLAELKQIRFDTIAKEYLGKENVQSNQIVTRPIINQIFAPDLWVLTKQHLFLVFGALTPAIAVGILLGIGATYLASARHLILNSISIIQTIPSLALLAFLIPIFHEIGTVPALVALFLYSLLPIVRNTYAGLTNIPVSLQDAAAAMGLPIFYRLIWIEIPLASRTILAGIKTAAVLNVGMGTIAAFIGAGGYGERIVTGLALNNYEMMLSGAIPACTMAIAIQLSFDLLDYVFIPKGLKNLSD